MKKFLSLGLAAALALSMAAPAFAEDHEIKLPGGDAEVPVELTVTAATFSVTVPSAFVVNVDGEGVVTEATNAKIINNSQGKVKVNSVTVAGQNGWALDATTENEEAFKGMAVNTKAFAFTINNDRAQADGTVDVSDWAVLAAADGAEGGADELAIPYDVFLAPQADEISSQEMASVVFVIGWDTGATND